MSTLGNNLLAQYYAQNIIPTKGLVLYAPLNEIVQNAKTGQIITYNGQPIKTEKNGMPCLEFSPNQYMYVNAVNNNPIDTYSASCWMRLEDDTITNNGPYFTVQYGLAFSQAGYDTRIAFAQKSTQLIGLSYVFIDIFSDIIMEPKKFYHFVIVYDGTRTYLYINSNNKCVYVHSMNRTSMYILLHTISTDNYHSACTTQYCGLRYYNRVLSQNEINALYHEFTPTP